jgi:RNA polymerase sigma-70 factor (ECF subfamily)
MARAYARWTTVQTYDNPSGWVYRVALNWARSVHRRAVRKLPLRGRDEVVQPPVPDPAIAKALADLDVRLRAVVVCRCLLDWSVDETAHALGIKPGTVKSRLHRALAILESALGHLR